MMTDRERKFLEKAIELSRKAMETGVGGPFGCVVVKDDEVIGEGWNKVTSTNDPTAHAEVVAIRAACTFLGTFQLDGCEIYTSCEPCPMCLGAIYWARPDRVVYSNTKEEAAAIEFDDDFIYAEINTSIGERRIEFIHFPQEAAREVFRRWKEMEGKRRY
jgi:guanine deaminase